MPNPDTPAHFRIAPDNHHDSDGDEANSPEGRDWPQITIAIFTAGLFLVNILLWCSTKKAADAAKGAANAAEGQLRPWLDADVTGVRITFDAVGNANVEVTVKVANLGHSPAIDVNVIPNIINQLELVNVDQIQEKMCDQFKTEPAEWGPAIFSGKDFTRTYGVSVSKADVDKTGNIFVPNIVGAVCYTAKRNGEHHQSNFFYSIIKEKLPSGQLVNINVKNGRTIMPQQIAFARLYEMGNSAN